MSKWINRAIYQMPRNGTASHAVNPSSTVNLASGAAFTPTAGNLLVAVIGGAVTSTGTSGGGGSTAPAGGWSGGAAVASTRAVNNTGLYVAYKTAAGSDTLTVYHNGSNYPIVVAVYEFPAGSAFINSVSAVSVAWNGANPNLTGLTGTNLVMAVKQKGTTGASASDFVWSGAGSPIKDWMYYIFSGPTDGYETSLAYVEDYSGTSWQPTGTFSENTGTFESLTFAVNVSAGSTGTRVAYRWNGSEYVELTSHRWDGSYISIEQDRR